MKRRQYNAPYTGEYLNHVAFPLGGIGAGMLCLEGTGALSHVSLRGHPDVFNEPLMFSALCVRGEPNVARVLEGPVPAWKVFFPWGETFAGAGGGGGGKHYGLPHCAHAGFQARFPFGIVRLEDARIPLEMEITGWSPFTPGDADCSSLPVAALEYRFVNPTDELVEAVYSFHARNLMAVQERGDTPAAPDSAVWPTRDGFVLWQPGSGEQPWRQGAFSAVVDDPNVKVNCAWFRGGWFDSLTMVWKSVQDGATPEGGRVAEGAPSPGGSLYVPFRLEPGEEKGIRLRLAWHVPETDIRLGPELGDDEACSGASCGCGNEKEPALRRAEGNHEWAKGLPRHKPWYAGVFDDIEAVTGYWREHCDELRERTATFSDCFYDTTLPPEVVEAVAANLTILKSPTVLRQMDGRLWCWEGCCDEVGCCHGSCTHVWNYAQALPHLFPDLERSLRQTEFHENQDERGHQAFRASLPIRPTAHDFHAAADGQLGGIMKVHREWRISGDTDWLRGLWPRVKQSLDYCIETWDPEHEGALEEPHHNTYDIEFWGPDGMCTSFYLGALQAALAMSEALGHYELSAPVLGASPSPLSALVPGASPPSLPAPVPGASTPSLAAPVPGAPSSSLAAPNPGASPPSLPAPVPGASTPSLPAPVPGAPSSSLAAPVPGVPPPPLSAPVPGAAREEALPHDVSLYAELLKKGIAFMESVLWNGEYFAQQITWQGLRAGDPTKAQTLLGRTSYSPEALELLEREGPKYQYGAGCLSDGVLGAWIAACCGLGEFLDRGKVESHLLSVYRYNFKKDLSDHANPQRPTYALGTEGGLLLCTWPKAGRLSLPFVYSDEVWTGVEYQVASHLMMLGHVEQGLEIVRTLRDRYDGRVRNPFDEYECGHWYARALASYGLLQGLTGVQYDAMEKTLTIRPSIEGDFRAFLCTATGYGTVAVRAGKPFIEVRHGTIPCQKIVYDPSTNT